jgi:hypothetical protein
MTFSTVAAAMLAAALPQAAPQAAPVPSTTQATAPADDSPEEIAKDAARDLKDTRFYNKPGATRAQYNADWQRCRLIARGSRTPAGTVPVYYNPAYISPLAAGIGGGLGGLIGAAIVQGQQRRDNRRSCLLVGGWRLVELPDSETARITAMTDDQRSAFFDTIVGAPAVTGKVTELTRFSLAPDTALHLDAPLRTPGQVWLGKKVDSAAPFVLAPGEAALVLGFRRVEASAVGRSATVGLARYDMANHDLAYRPKDWKKIGDKTVYDLTVASKDKAAAYEVQVLRVTPGDYVVNSLSVGKLPLTASHCFGAPLAHVGAGEVAYLGDFVPYMGARLSTGDKLDALAYTSQIDDARATLAKQQPALAAALKPAAMKNGAAYACNAITMTRWDIDGLEALPPVVTTAAVN